MRRALELAACGLGKTRPNPMVGAVVVHHDRIIGEGYHRAWGEPHAEVMAINSVSNERLLPESTLYVTLEPCSHYGKTPPCSELIIRSRIPRVVVAMTDPNPVVSGKGIEMLRKAGIDVQVGLMEEEARLLNAPFLCEHTLDRPYVALKWAESADGFMDRLRTSSDVPPIIFSSAYRQRLVHRSRMEYMAILVGYRTALLDNPSLTNRHWWGYNPLRIILDPKLDLPEKIRLRTDTMAETVFLYDINRVNAIPPDTPSVRYISMDYTQGIAIGVCTVLRALNIQSVLVEGGSATLKEFINSGVYDHVEVEVSPQHLGDGVRSPIKLSYTNKA